VIAREREIGKPLTAEARKTAGKSDHRLPKIDESERDNLNPTHSRFPMTRTFYQPLFLPKLKSKSQLLWKGWGGMVSVRKKQRGRLGHAPHIKIEDGEKLRRRS
jgi:hypothetical protein